MKLFCKFMGHSFPKWPLQVGTMRRTCRRCRRVQIGVWCSTAPMQIPMESSLVDVRIVSRHWVQILDERTEDTK